MFCPGALADRVRINRTYLLARTLVLTLLLLLCHHLCAGQVKSPVDASNFHAALDDNAAGGAYRGKPYVSKGDFKDF
jgi:hypothetical protein